MHRFGPSTLIEAGGHTLIFDAGRGAMQRLDQLGVRWDEVTGLFLSHLHSDHVVGIPDLWLTGWLMSRRARPLRLWGPRGTRRMARHLRQAFAYDIEVRVSGDGLPAGGAEIVSEDVREGTVFDENGVKVTAFEVDHRPVEPAFGYRIDHAGHVVVLSGDTRSSENLVRYASGADLLILNVVSGESLHRAGIAADAAQRIVGNHTTPEESGAIFARVQPRLAVYSHIASARTATSEDLLPPTRKTYSGSVELGEDLMVIHVGTSMRVDRAGCPSMRYTHEHAP
jgi:ribonuclease Z